MNLKTLEFYVHNKAVHYKDLSVLVIVYSKEFQSPSPIPICVPVSKQPNA